MTSSSSTGAGAAAEAAAAAMQQPGFAISSFPLFIIFLFFAKECVHASLLRPPPPPTDGGDQAGCLSDSLLSLSSSAAEAGAFGGHTHSRHFDRRRDQGDI